MGGGGGVAKGARASTSPRRFTRLSPSLYLALYTSLYVAFSRLGAEAHGHVLDDVWMSDDVTRALVRVRVRVRVRG